MFRYGNTNADAIKLKLFPSSLAGEAKIWFNELNPSVITTWEEMKHAFDHQSHYRDENRNSNPSKENPPIPRLPKKKLDESEFEKTMREFVVAQKAANDFEVRINVPLVDVLAGIPNYGKFLKDLVSNKSKMEQIYDAFLTKECSAILQNKLPPKLGDPESFLIPCKLANSVEYLALVDLGTSINLMPYSLYAALSGTTLKPTRISIRLANHTYQYPMGVVENMLVQVGKFMFSVDFVILQMEEDDRVPLIL
ncbi:reverse transcriptase domain-containing protein [Tanacetum coccineum]